MQSETANAGSSSTYSFFACSFFSSVYIELLLRFLLSLYVPGGIKITRIKISSPQVGNPGAGGQFEIYFREFSAM